MAKGKPKMKKTVLLVTNSVLTREVLTEAFDAQGYDVLLTEDTWDAVGCCGESEVDVLLMDLDWPGDRAWEGWELIEGALGVKPGLPIIIITGRADLIEAARLAGARGLAGKPVDVGALVELVEELVSERAAQGANRIFPHDHDFRLVAADGEAFRAALEERFHRPFLTVGFGRHWGLNE
jgi:DNA-binding NtrC family response regulator